MVGGESGVCMMNTCLWCCWFLVMLLGKFPPGKWAKRYGDTIYICADDWRFTTNTKGGGGGIKASWMP